MLCKNQPLSLLPNTVGVPVKFAETQVSPVNRSPPLPETWTLRLRAFCC